MFDIKRDKKIWGVTNPDEPQVKMFKILSDEERIKVIVASSTLKEIRFADLHRNLCKAEQKNTLRQVIEWGNETCPHTEDWGVQPKGVCSECWAELEKESK